MLTQEQREQIIPLIIDHLGTSLSGSAAINLFGVEAIRSLPGGQNDYARASTLLNHVLRAPDWAVLARVVETVDVAGVLVDVHRLIDGLRHNTIKWRPPGTNDLWVPLAWPFADRQALRKILCDVARGAGPAAMTIEAPAGHGKQTMCCYIELCAQRHGRFDPVVERLSRVGDPRVLDLLAMRLRTRLFDRPGMLATTHHEPERRAAAMARDLARDATLGGRRVWFVANVQDAELDDGVLRFVDELLRQVQQDPLVAERLRVTVLADDIAALGLTNLPDLANRHTLPVIAEPEIAAWLRDAAPGLDKRLYDLTANVILERTEQFGPTARLRLSMLAQQCVIAHRELLGASR